MTTHRFLERWPNQLSVWERQFCLPLATSLHYRAHLLQAVSVAAQHPFSFEETLRNLVPVGPPADERPGSGVSAQDDQRARVGTRPVIYGEYYGLRENPFTLTPDPRFLFLTPRHREALSNLRYGLATPKGFTLLLGDAGTGKTTLVRAILAELNDPQHRYVVISNPTLSRGEFYELLVRELGLSCGPSTSKPQFLAELQRDVEERFSAGGLTGLIIDEAQSLPHELLEEIRLLGNMETTTVKLLNIVLSGQPELAARLNDPSLRQLCSL